MQISGLKRVFNKQNRDMLHLFKKEEAADPPTIIKGILPLSLIKPGFYPRIFRKRLNSLSA